METEFVKRIGKDVKNNYKTVPDSIFITFILLNIYNTRPLEQDVVIFDGLFTFNTPNKYLIKF